MSTNKSLKFLCIQPDNTYYVWQVHAWLESLRNIEQSNKAIVLIFVPYNSSKSDLWENLISLYPETEFTFYSDYTNEITHKLSVYIPILRLWCAAKHFKNHPELVNSAIFYCDSDVIFTKMPQIEDFINDDIIYLSNTNSYISSYYFDVKIKDVLPEQLEEYRHQDVLADLCKIVGITRDVAIQNIDHSGGAQYLLKNINYTFWEKCIEDCLNIRTHLLKINAKYFKDEISGFQSWCSDMWAVLYNLWFNNQTTRVVPQLNFAWATDPISKLDNVSILHNAGIVNDNAHEFPVFYKGKYHTGKTNPLDDLEYLTSIIEHPKSKLRCTSYYAQKLLDLKNKYSFTNKK